MKYKDFAEQILALQKSDLQLRERLVAEGRLGDGYDPEMQLLHQQNAASLEDIMDAIGFPSIAKVGDEAHEAAWLVIQHSIGHPAFMKRCAKLLERAVQQEDANPRLLAYLTDRIAMYEGKIQLYGTQFDWDDQGELSPLPYDDLEKVNERRASLGLNTLEEQTMILRAQALRDGEKPPKNPSERAKAFDDWRRAVGWIK